MSAPLRVLIADAVEEGAKSLLEAEGLSVDYRPDVTPGELPLAVGSAHGLIVRSRTKVDAGVLGSSRTLRVIGRAGAGVDNIDVDEATRRGIVVMNTPGGNTLSTAEHTIAMMLALARNIPAADRSVRSMEWERSRFTGTEISGKVLGLVGLGRVGREVARLAGSLGMNVLAFDPLVTDAAAKLLGVEAVPLADLFRRADFLSVHTPLTPETKGLVGYEALRSCRRGVRIINCARGGIVDERALVRALDEGLVAGAALDVFEEEPPLNRDLVNHPGIICTPHLGASTEEAQSKVALQIARQVADFLAGRGIAGAVNARALSAAMSADIRPYLALAERMGALVARLRSGTTRSIALTLRGPFPRDPGEALMSSIIVGYLSPSLSEPVNLVNARAIAAERGLSLTVSSGPSGRHPLELFAEFATERETRTVTGTIFGEDDPRITGLDGYALELKPGGNLLVYSNVDRPGMLAKVSGLLADHSLNIAGLVLGRDEKKKKALTVISLDAPVPGELLRKLADIEGFSDIHAVEL